MKSLLDALGQLLQVYADVECRACHGVGLHFDSCSWQVVAAWHKDSTSMLDRIRAKAGLQLESKPDADVPGEIMERQKAGQE